LTCGGEKVRIKVERSVELEKYRGILGKANAEELLKFEEEAII
jgi:hypothetical protein